MTSSSIPVEPIAVEMVVDLINEHADITRLAAGETNDAYPILEWTVTTAAKPQELIEVANELYAIFAKPDNATRALNDLADRAGITHRLNTASELVWTQTSGSNKLQAAATTSLIDFIASHGTDPLGTCNAHQCLDVYIDRSQAQARTYCSQRCNNRTRAARWRARHKDSPTQSQPDTHR